MWERTTDINKIYEKENKEIPKGAIVEGYRQIPNGRLMLLARN